MGEGRKERSDEERSKERLRAWGKTAGRGSWEHSSRAECLGGQALLPKVLGALALGHSGLHPGSSREPSVVSGSYKRAFSEELATQFEFQSAFLDSQPSSPGPGCGHPRSLPGPGQAWMAALAPPCSSESWGPWYTQRAQPRARPV